MSSSDSDSSEEQQFSRPRLGDCEVCGANKALYTCPKCEVKTCCLGCVQIHKRELECDGIRDRTKFVRMKDFTDTDLLSDYRLLEECARFVYAVKRDEKKRFTRIDKDLPIHLYKLKMAARKRGTILQFLAQNFSRHKINTTRYNFKSNIIYWRMEWIFPNVDSEPLKFIDEKCSENSSFSVLLDKYLNPDAAPFERSKALAFYKSVGFNGVKILLRAEKVKGSARKFFELDTKETLAENLSGKCIVEFPIIFVVLKDHAYNFEIITPEEEFNYNKNEKIETKGQELSNQSSESQRKVANENKSDDRMKSNGSRSYERNNYSPIINGESGQRIDQTIRRRPRELLTEKIAREKNMQIEKELKEAKKKRPKNLLFTTGYSSDESLVSGSDSES